MDVSGGESVKCESLFGREFVFEGLGYVVDGGVLAELLELFVVGDALQADLSGDLAVHAEYGGDLFFCQEEDLQHEVIAFLGAAAHARLTHEDDARQQDGFECYEGAEKRVGWRIEVARVGERGCVEDHPAGEDRQVDADEEKAACEAGDGVAEAFGWGATNEEVLFVFRDKVDVLFDVALGHIGEMRDMGRPSRPEKMIRIPFWMVFFLGMFFVFLQGVLGKTGVLDVVF